MLATGIYILWDVIEILRQFFFEEITADFRFDEKVVGGNELP
jgi:hypothetical protein